ncbi:MAG: hypothetical protein A2V66_08240 [Ignavibacteria bacterium RBG_13_36_8]|nr:MAG: hypothetical protein A2V66_08240 [Ignavibacteria bacterium RBG_13_36_8]
MKLAKKIEIIFFFFILDILITGCLEDNILTILDFEINNSADLLLYLEGNGDYFNSLEAPAVLNSNTVYYSLGTSLVIDIRTPEEYQNGHIRHAINISHDNLFEYLKNISTDYSYSKIIIVSSTGQAAAYYTCLLRLYGFNNVYFMNYGMASWNIDFAEPWISALNNSSYLNFFTNFTTQKPDYTRLPSISFSQENLNVEEKLDERIALLMNIPFDDTRHSNLNSTCCIDFDTFMRTEFDNPNSYLICFGDDGLYYYGSQGNQLNPGHPRGTVLYKAIPPYFELRCDKYLQTIPAEKTIYLYSYNGQLSAAAVAYLRELGYEAKSILFGGNTMFYSRMSDPTYDWLIRWAFIPSDIPNFPYEIE